VKNSLSINAALYNRIKVELTSTNKIRFTSLVAGETIAMEQGTAGTAAATNSIANIFGAGSSTSFTAYTAIGSDTRKGFTIKSKEKGSSTNLISVVKSSKKSVTDSNVLVHKIEVLLNGKVKETYDDVDVDTAFSLSTTGTFMKVINDASEYIEFDDDNADTPEFPDRFPDGTYTLGTANYVGIATDIASPTATYTYKVGIDGIVTYPVNAATLRNMYLTALSTTGDLANSELYDYHIMITPDTQDEVVQDLAIALADSRKDFIYIADVPIGLTYLNAVDWHNGNYSASGKERNNQIVSSYAAVYAPWVKMTNQVTGVATWVPPSVVVADKYLELDKSFGPWVAPAGDNRGILQGVSDYEYSPSKAQRDEMYGDPNVINPIVFFNTKGIEIYGEKTGLREEGKAMSRIHVRRLVIYAAKFIKKALEGFIYESNSPATWARASEKINGILDTIRTAGGLSNYQIVIDSTNNTAADIVNNKMNVIIRMIPFGVIETIDINLSVDMTGATIV